jgi:hypothetical protein
MLRSPPGRAPSRGASMRAESEGSSTLSRRLTRTGSAVELEDCELLEAIGSGGEGVVYRALWQGSLVAVKVWHDTGLSEEQLTNICREARRTQAPACVLAAHRLTHRLPRWRCCAS